MDSNVGIIVNILQSIERGGEKVEYNIYCDESCHLENDKINVMVLGAIWCPRSKIKEVNERIVQIKARNNVYKGSEIKWTKVSPVKEQLYLDIVDYFFDDDDLHFRGLVIPDKSVLKHEKYNQTHDDWYYKMYFNMLKVIFQPCDNYDVYIDIKDSNTYKKAQKLHEVCCNSVYDFSGRIIKKIQPIRSNEVQLMQIVDILIGAVAYQNREFPEDFRQSPAKQSIIKRIRERSGYQLTKTTLYREDKVNILIWDAEY